MTNTTRMAIPLFFNIYSKISENLTWLHMDRQWGIYRWQTYNIRITVHSIKQSGTKNKHRGMAKNFTQANKFIKFTDCKHNVWKWNFARPFTVNEGKSLMKEDIFSLHRENRSRWRNRCFAVT